MFRVTLLLVQVWIAMGFMFSKYTENPQSLNEATLGNFVVRWDATEPYLQIVSSSNPDHIVFQTLAHWPFITVGFATETRAPIIDGNYKANEWTLYETPYQSIKSVTVHENEILFKGEVYGLVTQASYVLTFFKSPRTAQLAFDLQVTPILGKINRLFLNYWCDSKESFHGFGLQYTHWNLKGRRIPIMVAEQGVGRGLQPITSFLNVLADGAGGDWTTTYAPKPLYVTSQNRSIVFENSEAMYIDLRDDDAVVVEVWGNAMRGRIISASSMLDAVEEITSITGRMKQLPRWTQEGAVVGLEGGTVEASHHMDIIQKYGVPVAGIWLQDWVGLRHAFDGDRLVWNWVLDESYYPQWDQAVDKWHESGARVLSYINPFFSNPINFTANITRNLYAEGIELEYFVKTSNGSPYVMRSGSIEFCMVDFTNPDARTWMKDIIKYEMLAKTKVSGWMADFGEYLPFDAKLFNGESGALHHNKYPEEWAKVNEEAVAEYEQELIRDGKAGSSVEPVYFMRSAWLESPGHTSLFWLGDQLVTWDGYDGIKSVITSALSGGLGGHSLTHSDIGGYTVEEIGPVHYTRSKELLLRWMELSAFGSCMFRSHIGSTTSPTNAQIYTDDDTLRHFAAFTGIFTHLAEYRYTLMQQAEEKGYPVMRPMSMHYSYDPVTYSLMEQYMFGEEFMVAPTMDPGQQGNQYLVNVKVYIPASSVWVHVWTGMEVHGGSSGRYVVVPSLIGQPPVFYRPGSVVGEKLVAYLRDQNLITISQWGIKETFNDFVPGDWTTWLGVSDYVSDWRSMIDVAISAATVDAVIETASSSLLMSAASST